MVEFKLICVVKIEVLGSEKHIETFSGYVESQLRKLVEKLTVLRLPFSAAFVIFGCLGGFGCED